MPELIELPKLIQPREHKASVVIWSDLTVNDIDEINNTENAEQTKRVLADIFHLEDHADNQQTAILLDLYYYTINFAHQNSFSKEQTSAVFSIVKKTHEVCIETPFGNVDQCFNYFKELLLCHAVKRPPFSMDLFSAEEVRAITDYVINTYFRHFKMYKYIFTPQVRLDLAMAYIGMPPSPTPPPVEEEELTNAEATSEDQERKSATPDGATSVKDGEEVKETDIGESTEEQAEKVDVKAVAVSELRSIIRAELGDEIKKIKSSLEDQIKQSEDSINTKLSTAEGGGKGGRGSAKGKKK